MNEYTEILESIIHNLWSVSWQVSILIGIIWLVDRMNSRASSLFKYWLWCIVLVRLCVPVSIELPTGIDTSFTERIELRAPKFSELPILQTLPDEFEPLSPQEKMVVSESSVQKSFLHSLTATQWFGIFWIFSITAIVLALFVHVIVISRRLKRSKPIYNPELVTLLEKLSGKIGISRPVELLYMDKSIGDVPAAAGFVRQRIFLPPRLADDWPIDDLKPVLLHELAHIKRKDLLVNWLQIAVQAVYFFHPFIWFVNKKIRLLREEVCDDIAVHLAGDKRKQYTLSMLRVVENAVHEPSLGFVGIGFTERKSTIRARITRILSDTYRMATRLSLFSVVLLILIGVTGISVTCKKSADGHGENEQNTSQPEKKYTIITIKEKGKYTIDDHNVTVESFDAYMAQIRAEYDSLNDSLNILIQADFYKQLDDIVLLMKMMRIMRKESVEIEIIHPETKEAKRAKLSLYEGDDPEFIDGIIVDYGSDTQEIKKDNKIIKLPNTFVIKRREKPTGSDIKSLFESASDHVKYKEHDKAISCYKKIINDFPDDPQIDNAWLKMGYAYHASGIEHEMVRAFRNVSRNNKELFTTARFLAAQALQKENRHEDVIDIISYAVEDTSFFDIGDNFRLAQFYIMRGNAYKSMNKYDEALDDYDCAYNYNQHNIKEKAVLYRIDIFIEQKRFKIAERELKELMKSNNEQIRRNAQIRLDQLIKAGDNSVEVDIEHPETVREQEVVSAPLLVVRTKKTLFTKTSLLDAQTYLDLYNSTEDQSEKLGYGKIKIHKISLVISKKQGVDNNVIRLNSYENIIEHSLRLIVNGDTLRHGDDYTYNYENGKIKLLKKEALSPEANIVIKYMSDAPQENREPIVIEISSQGNYYINEIITPEDSLGIVVEKLQRKRKKTVTVRADRGVNADKIRKLMKELIKPIKNIDDYSIKEPDTPHKMLTIDIINKKEKNEKKLTKDLHTLYATINKEGDILIDGFFNLGDITIIENIHNSRLLIKPIHVIIEAENEDQHQRLLKLLNVKVQNNQR